MTTTVTSASAETSLLGGQQLMLKGGFRHLPVVGVEGKLIGLLSQDDLLGALSSLVTMDSSALSKLDRVPIGEYMVNTPLSTRPETELVEAVLLIRKHRIGCLPVVDADGVLLGILTETDLIDLLLELLERGES